MKQLRVTYSVEDGYVGKCRPQRVYILDRLDAEGEFWVEINAGEYTHGAYEWHEGSETLIMGSVEYPKLCLSATTKEEAQRLVEADIARREAGEVCSTCGTTDSTICSNAFHVQEPHGVVDWEGLRSALKDYIGVSFISSDDNILDDLIELTKAHLAGGEGS